MKTVQVNLAVKVRFTANGQDPELIDKIIDRVIGEIDNMEVYIHGEGIEGAVSDMVKGHYEIPDFEASVIAVLNKQIKDADAAEVEPATPNP